MGSTFNLVQVVHHLHWIIVYIPYDMTYLYVYVYVHNFMARALCTLNEQQMTRVAIIINYVTRATIPRSYPIVTYSLTSLTSSCVVWDPQGSIF